MVVSLQQHPFTKVLYDWVVPAALGVDATVVGEFSAQIAMGVDQLYLTGFRSVDASRGWMGLCYVG